MKFGKLAAARADADDAGRDHCGSAQFHVRDRVVEEEARPEKVVLETPSGDRNLKC
jgi:hypothetical protein